MHGPNITSMRRFNHMHAKMRVVVENAFGRLKGRWNVLRMICSHPSLAASVQEVTVALHNFLEEWRGRYVESVETEEEHVPEAPEPVESYESPLSQEARRRVGLVKALGLTWVDEAP